MIILRRKSIIIWASFFVTALVAINYLPFFLPGPFKVDARTVGDIAAPRGYVKMDGDDAAYTEFLRSIPLKEENAVHYFEGGDVARGSSSRSYAVVDLPLLSNNEQCADACMHIRSEYLYRSGQYGRICFTTAAGVPMRYMGGRMRKAFESYMRTVFNYANTESLVMELPNREIKDVQPGDMFVYKARKGHKYGHAIMVMDVAVNLKTGKKSVLLAEGCTPAVDIHVLRNGRSAWFPVDDKAETLYLSIFKFHRDELRRFK